MQELVQTRKRQKSILQSYAGWPYWPQQAKKDFLPAAVRKLKEGLLSYNSNFGYYNSKGYYGTIVIWVIRIVRDII